jgi:hypothetical protein
MMIFKQNQDPCLRNKKTIVPAFSNLIQIIVEITRVKHLMGLSTVRQFDKLNQMIASCGIHCIF